MLVREVIEHTIERRDSLSTEARAIFDRYYAQCLGPDASSWLDRNESAFAEMYGLLGPGVRVLDIGCGCGSESIAFASTGASVNAIDVAKVRLRCAKERAAMFDFAPPIFSIADVFNLEGQYDLIWMNMTYHHIEPREQFAAKLKSLLRPGGHVVVSEINGANPLQQAMHFRQRGFKTIVTAVDEAGKTIPYGNERILTAGALTRNMVAGGLRKLSQRYHRILPNKARLTGIEDRLSSWPLPSPAKSHMVLVFQA